MAVTDARARELCDLVLGIDKHADAAPLMLALGQAASTQGNHA